jgi:branched-chain amino acid transport system ATP-binding protein
MSELLRIDELRVAYGSIEALHGVTLAVSEGEAVAVLGANGAGKTTLLRAISGVLKPKSGRIVFADRDIAGRPAHKVVRLGISQVPEGRLVFGRLSVTDNLRLGAWPIYGGKLPPSAARPIFDLFPRLEERKDQLAGTLSGGEQQMLAVGRALVSRPRILLLDEPSMGLSPMIANSIFGAIKTINADQGVAVLLVEQNITRALATASRGYILERGRIAEEGPAGDLSTDAIKSAYLGG